MPSLTEDKIKRAHQTSIRLTLPASVQLLREILGSRLVAHLAASRDPRAVADWAEGTRAPRTATEARLRTALQIVEMLQAVESEHVVRAWFIGQNPQLDDDAPATAISEGRLKDVLAAARAFVQAG
jgi:hypothetical protein